MQLRKDGLTEQMAPSQELGAGGGGVRGRERPAKKWPTDPVGGEQNTNAPAIS